MKKFLILFYCLLSFGSAFSQLTTTKITELPAASNADSGDVFPFVDISASKTKKITAYNLFYEIDSTIAALNDTVTSLRNANNALVDSIAVLRELISLIDTTTPEPEPEPILASIYYVDYTNGNDLNTGTHPDSAWKTITKVNSATFIAGDTIAFKENETWYETLLITDSGNIDSNIVFTSYGSGSKPKISQRDELPGWNNSGNWTLHDGTNHIWKFNLAQSGISANLSGLWLDGNYYKRAYDVSTDNFPFDSTLINYSDETTYPGIDANYRWMIKYDSTAFYLYSLTNPASEYSLIETNIRTADPANWENIKGTNSNYITIDGLQFEGGFHSVLLDSCTNWTFKNNENYYAARGMFLTNGSNYNTVNNNIFDSKQSQLVNGDLSYYGNSILSVVNGIFLYQSASYNSFYGNTIIDFAHGGFELSTAATSGSVNYNLIDSNYFYFNNRSGRSFGIFADAGVTDFIVGNVITRNLIENQKQADNWAGDSTIFIYNIYNKINSQTIPLYGGWGNAAQGNGEKSYFINNTFYLTYKEALYPEQGAFRGRVENNLFINCNTLSSDHYAVNMTTQGYDQHQVWKNNLFYYDVRDSSNYMARYQSTLYTIPDWNSNDAGDDTISGNFQHTGSLSALVDTSDFSYPIGSIALSAGVELPAWVKTKLIEKFPNGFRKRDYTLVLQSDLTQVNNDVGAGSK